MRKLVLIFMLVSVPFSAFMTVYQVFRSEQLRRDISVLAEKQQGLFERNKRMIANIAILRSPERIDELARKELHLKEIDDKRIIHIEITGQEGGGE